MSEIIERESRWADVLKRQALRLKGGHQRVFTHMSTEWISKTSFIEYF